VAGLRAGDEAIFAELMDLYGASMTRVARMYVPTPALAEEVVQETWLAVLRSIAGFEGRSSLRTWIFRILVNRARSVADSEGRSLPFSALAVEDDRPAVDPDRFLADGRWSSPSSRSGEQPEDHALTSELHEQLRAALGELSAAQRAVVTLRDVHGFSAREVCDLLELTPVNQRVLLHRGRSRLRALIERYVGAREQPPAHGA
jgi:RNA polymerase sigma-70 factor (ECF subfamily)